MARQKERAPQHADLGGTVLEGSDEAAKLPTRLDRYSSARERAKQMLSHLRGVQQSRDPGHPLSFGREVAELSACGNYLLFHHYYTVGKVRLAAMRSCRIHLLCPLCAIRRAAKTLKGYLDRYRVIQARDGSLRPFLVTFTVKNGPDLAERQAHLQESLKRLHNRRRHWFKGSKGAKWTESARAAGAVWSYEVTNKGNGWHPHAHAVWMCSVAPDKYALQAEWQAITGDSFMVDVRPIEGDPVEGFCEVFKYAMKFSELGLAQNVEAYQTLRGRRLVGSFGVFRGVYVSPEMADELLDDLPYVELLYRYRDGSGYSLLHCSSPVKGREADAVNP